LSDGNLSDAQFKHIFFKQSEQLAQFRPFITKASFLLSLLSNDHTSQFTKWSHDSLCLYFYVFCCCDVTCLVSLTHFEVFAYDAFLMLVLSDQGWWYLKLSLPLRQAHLCILPTKSLKYSCFASFPFNSLFSLCLAI